MFVILPISIMKNEYLHSHKMNVIFYNNYPFPLFPLDISSSSSFLFPHCFNEIHLTFLKIQTNMFTRRILPLIILAISLALTIDNTDLNPREKLPLTICTYNTSIIVELKPNLIQ